MGKKKILICGATGYIGLQLTKLLCTHKKIKIKYLCGSSSVGKKIDSYERELKKYKLPKITKFKKEYLFLFMYLIDLCWEILFESF